MNLDFKSPANQCGCFIAYDSRYRAISKMTTNIIVIIVTFVSFVRTTVKVVALPSVLIKNPISF